jgi:hypothetical protein
MPGDDAAARHSVRSRRLPGAGMRRVCRRTSDTKIGGALIAAHRSRSNTSRAGIERREIWAYLTTNIQLQEQIDG